MFDAAAHEPVTFGSEAPALAIGNTCASSWCFPETSPLVSLLICVFSFVVIQTFLICAMFGRGRFNTMLVILASAQLKAPGRYPSFDLQSQTDCVQHLILSKSRGLCPSIFQSRNFLKLFSHVCENIKLVEACDGLISSDKGPFCWETPLVKSSNNDLIVLSQLPSSSLCIINLDTDPWCLFIQLHALVRWTIRESQSLYQCLDYEKIETYMKSSRFNEKKSTKRFNTRSVLLYFWSMKNHFNYRNHIYWD